MTESLPTFNTMEELLAHYYPDTSEEIQKIDAPLLSSTGGWYNAVYGAKVWEQLNKEVNAFAILPKLPWNQSGWRVESAEPVARASWAGGIGGVAENASPLTSDSVMPTWTALTTGVKEIWNHFEISNAAEFLSGVDDSIAAVAELRKDIASFHALQLNEMLMLDVDDITNTNNLQSIDRVVSNAAEEALITAGDGDIYGIDRTSDAWADAVVNHNSDADRVLTLKIIDETMRDIMTNGGQTKVILTGYDTLFEWLGLLEAQRRYMPSVGMQTTSFNGVQAVSPGVEAGFMVNTYQGIPIIPTQRCFNGGSGISHIYFLDTDHLHIRVAKPTQYIEQRDPLAIDRFGMVGGFYTMAELICTNFKSQGKIRDLVAA